MDEPEFKRFPNRLDRTAMSDPFAVWLAGAIVTEVTTMPINQRVADP